MGQCESCGRNTACNDVPASKLPAVNTPKEDNEPKFSENEVVNLIGKMYQDLYLWTGIDDSTWILDNIINPKSQADEQA